MEEAFNTRELLKIKVLEGAPGSPREMAEEICKALPETQIVQTIGRMAVLYRPSRD